MILGIEVLDIVGYLGTLIVILSFMCKDIQLLRYTSIIACLVFIVYAIFKEDVPIIVTNVSIISVNVFRMVKDYRKN